MLLATARLAKGSQENLSDFFLKSCALAGFNLATHSSSLLVDILYHYVDPAARVNVSSFSPSHLETIQGLLH
jgi:hypothetical protein